MQQISDLEKLAALRQSGVLTEDEFQVAKKRLVNHIADPDKPPQWMRPAGAYACLLGIAAALFIFISKNNNNNGDVMDGLIAIVTNPICLILIPLGGYWLWRTDPEQTGPPKFSNR